MWRAHVRVRGRTWQDAPCCRHGLLFSQLRAAAVCTCGHCKLVCLLSGRWRHCLPHCLPVRRILACAAEWQNRPPWSWPLCPAPAHGVNALPGGPRGIFNWHSTPAVYAPGDVHTCPAAGNWLTSQPSGVKPAACAPADVVCRLRLARPRTSCDLLQPALWRVTGPLHGMLPRRSGTAQAAVEREHVPLAITV